jgi:hypothetical protein
MMAAGNQQMNLKIQYRLKQRGMAPMAKASIRRDILAALMESPFYFNIPLRERLKFLSNLLEFFDYKQSRRSD